MTFVLIIVLNFSGTAAMTIPYPDKAACEAKAGRYVRDAFCVPGPASR